jgi:hypothetical protein
MGETAKPQARRIGPVLQVALPIKPRIGGKLLAIHRISNQHDGAHIHAPAREEIRCEPIPSADLGFYDNDAPVP